ncbi:MAG: hypothetical protein ACHRHE_04585 [Tepidisphaerales bacterium]
MSKDNPDTSASVQGLKATPVLDYRSPDLPPSQTIQITARTLVILRQSGVSARVISYIMLIGGGLIVILGLGMLHAAVPLEGVVIVIMIGLAVAGPSVFLSRCGRHAREFLGTLDGTMLEKSLEASWMFWKTVALVIVMAICAVVGLAVAGVLHF